MTLWRRLRYLLPGCRRAAEREMQEELQSLAAIAPPHELGNLTLAAENARAAWGWTRLEQIQQDLAYALRSLRRNPLFAAAAVLTLALGIGATSAIFSMLDVVALRPLPYTDPGRLVWMTQILKKNSTDEVTLTAYFLIWRMENRSFVDLAGYNYQTRNLTGAGQPMELQTARASASLLPLLGVQPALGRNFLKREDYKGRDQVTLLSYGLWQRQFGGDPKLLGRSIILDGASFVVVGILPRGFMFPGPDPVDLITPLGKDEAAELQYKIGSIIHGIIGRLKPEVSEEQARAEINVIQSRLPIPAFRPAITLKMMPLHGYLFGDARAAAMLLFAAAAFLLLITCANVANLFLTRLMRRDRELAIRAALGGSRGRLISQLLTESFLLGALSCLLGMLLAYGLRRPLFAVVPYHGAGLDRLPFDGRVLAFAAALAILTTLLFGLIPAWRATEIRLGEAVKTGQTSVAASRGGLRMLSLVAAAEIATVLILSTGAGLMLQSFWKLRYQNLGFQPSRLVVATISLAGPRYRSVPQRLAFGRDLLETAQSLPGVESAALTSSGELPPGLGHATNTFAVEGRDQPLGGPRPIARYPRISPAYFGMLGIPLLKGRLPNRSDDANAPAIVVVNESLVRRYFERENPLGRRIRTGDRGDEAWRTIVGVVGDVKASGLTAAAEPAVYLPYFQTSGSPDVALVLRTSLDPGVIAGELRKRLVGLDPNQPIARIQTMNDRLSESVSMPRFTAALWLAFAGLAVVLGWIGVYGVMGCRVQWQLRELAVRQALGALPREIFRFVLRQGVSIVLPGVLLGLIGAAALNRLLSSLLYGVSPHDPLTFAAVSLALIGAALLACGIPATRVAHEDPLPRLRQD